MSTRDEDKIANAIVDLTHQLSRVAWAIEVERIGSMPNNTFEQAPCSKCGSQLMPIEGDTCPACLEVKKDYSSS